MATDVKYRTDDASNNNVIGKKGQLFPKKAEVDLSFENLTYTVNTFSKFKKVKKEILHGINGSFQSGQLTAIMGPSGCGKSTLLNVLAGYSISGSSGQVYLNDSLRDEKQMANISCYIQQDDYVRDLLTVRESMTVAAHLKLPTTVSAISKASQVEDLLDALGLSIHGDTVTKRLSGGQKKRLSIALELITNPSILFLDEPTTGLDSQSCSQFVSLMADLAHNQSRTMVCTLHQPSALLFEKFDQIYALSSGQCIYQGPPNFVIPYFAERTIVCPPYHNPADFLIEVAIGEYGTDVLVKLADTTKITYIKDHNNCHLISEDQELQLENGTCLKNNNIADKRQTFKSKILNKPPYYLQAYHLYLRNVIMYKRNKILCCLVYIVPSYIMTSQPLELMRFSYFTIFLVVTSLTSQSTGFLCGATMPVKVSVFVGPVFVVLLSVFGFAIRFTDIPAIYVWLHYFSFVRGSFQSLVYTLYGFGRGVLPCSDEMYCHYKNPMKFLTEMEFAQVNIYPEFFYICFFFLCTYVLTTTVIWYRLNKR
eukprot:XP_016662001.1 PREDICTED: ATP-binding cassette sub-family G member 4 isoform X2 [Acyrthosiphon pisum]